MPPFSAVECLVPLGNIMRLRSVSFKIFTGVLTALGPGLSRFYRKSIRMNQNKAQDWILKQFFFCHKAELFGTSSHRQIQRIPPGTVRVQPICNFHFAAKPLCFDIGRSVDQKQNDPNHASHKAKNILTFLSSFFYKYAKNASNDKPFCRFRLFLIVV